MKPQLSISEAFRSSWEIFKKQFWFLLSILLVLFAVSSISSYANRGFHAMPVVAVLINIAAAVFGIIVQMGLLKITVKMIHGEKATFDDLFSEYKLFWRYLGASILYGLMVIGGLILLIVPGIIWAIKYQLYRYLIVDKKMGIKESLRKSAEMTDGVKWDLFLFGLLIIGINIAGAIAFGVGLVIAIPVTVLASASVYVQLLKHERHAAEPAA